MVETEPHKVASIIEKFYTDSMAAPSIKTGAYLPCDPQARRMYPWMDSQCEDPFLLETPITRAENTTHSKRKWLHSSILDTCSFQECLQSLTNNKAPGPDGIANELLKHLPQEYKESLHKLFIIIMWATGLTPKAWKKSDTILVYKDKGSENDIASYRPIGLANTLYKWTRLITTTLYEYAETHSLLSTMQAGFRKHTDTIHQLQNLIMTLEDSKIFNKDVYALIVDFTSAFNTTDHDKLLWIMYDLGFPTDALDAVKNLYQDAHTRVCLPSGLYTNAIPIERGTIQGDTLSPFLFLLYMEPLLRWLHAGGRGYEYGCLHNIPQSLRLRP